MMSTRLGRFAPLHLLVASGLLSACASQGPSRLPPDRFNYNQAIAQSANEQMLLNLVRLRYSETPVFLAVSSVLTQYSYAGTLGVTGAGGASLGDPLWQVGAEGRYVFIERPTISYAPLTGDEFADQMLKPIPIERVFSLVSSGWPPRQLLLMTMFRINDKLNMAFEPSPEAIANYDEFNLIVDRMIALARRNALDVQRDADGKTRYFVFDAPADPETRRLIKEFKDDVGLDTDRSRFLITERRIGRGSDEMTMRVRSVLDLMGFLSQGVEIPDDHQERDFAEVTGFEDGGSGRRIPLHVLAQAERPENAFVTVRFQDYWFYIPQTDHESKRAFGLLAYLFQMQAPQQIQAGPMLTVPTG